MEKSLGTSLEVLTDQARARQKPKMEVRRGGGGRAALARAPPPPAPTRTRASPHTPAGAQILLAKSPQFDALAAAEQEARGSKAGGEEGSGEAATAAVPEQAAE